MGSIKKAFDLSGKTALITGGSRGLGLQIAEALGEQGAKIVLSSRKAGDLEEAQKHLAGLGIKAEWIAADNSKDEDVNRLAEEAIAKLGKVDILVNNAGAAGPQVVFKDRISGRPIEYPTLLSARGKPLQLEDIEIVPGSSAVPFNRQRFDGRTPQVRGEAKASGRPRHK